MVPLRIIKNDLIEKLFPLPKMNIDEFNYVYFWTFHDSNYSPNIMYQLKIHQFSLII